MGEDPASGGPLLPAVGNWRSHFGRVGGKLGGLQPMPFLGAPLFNEVPREFFGLLAGRNASLYLDVLDRLAPALEESGHLSRAEAAAVVEERLREHPEFEVKEEFPDAAAEATTLSGQAALVLRRLVETRWLLEPVRSDWQRLVLLNPSAELMLSALRQMARGDHGQFTDRLQIACSQLLNPDAFGEQGFADLEACLSNVRDGLRELRQMESGIERHTRRLLASETLRENLAVLYDDFSETIGHACYRELVRARLPSRILQARRRLDEVGANARVLDLMQRERLRRSPQVDAPTAASEIRVRMDELARLLDSVVPMADALDRRAADFARRAFARLRYLQETNSELRERVLAVFAHVDGLVSRGRLHEVREDLELPVISVVEVGLLSSDSLYRPRLRRVAGELEPVGEDVSETDVDEAMAELGANLRDTLNVIRANRFVERLAGGSGSRTGLADLPVSNDDDIADIIACLLHAGARDAAYRVESARDAEETSEPGRVTKAGYAIEEFTLEKK